jgi:hypothetical protein
MYISHILVTALATTSTAQAFNFGDEVHAATTNTKRTVGSLFSWINNMFTKAPTTSTCPAVWSEISTALTAQFLADGQCTDAARAAIRAAFHDCFNGACDGSLILANECANPENRGLERLCGNLGNLANEKQVGVADLIQFAAAHAIKTCPGGPTVPVKIGRADSDEANELGVLPHGNAGGSDLIKLFGKHTHLYCNERALTIFASFQRFLTHRSRRPNWRPYHRQATYCRPFQSRCINGFDRWYLGQ